MSGLRDGVARPAGVELTVVIAAFDAEATLGAQLDALAAQCVPFAWELVVADNGSTDGTAALARSYADRLPVRVVDASATRGAGAARNVGVSVARAPLVAFCDADDVVGDGWVAAMRTALRTHAFVAGRFDGERLNGPRVLRSRTIPQTAGLQESTRLPGLHAAGAGNMGIRADVFRAVGGFDPGCLFLEDTDLCWRVQLAGVPLTWVPEAVLHVRLRGTLRSTLQQGYHYGSGEHWLALRYREQEERLRALAGAGDGPPTGAVPTGPGVPATGRATTHPVARAAAEADHHVGWRRAVHRLRLTAGDLARVRSVAGFRSWCWDLGFGLGFAFARLDTPSPVAVTRVAPGSAAAATLPPADRTVPA